MQERELFKKPLSKAELQDIAREVGGVSELFSWKSPTARKLGLKPSGQPDEKLLELMIKEPALIRRPIIRKEGKIQLGFGKPGLTV